MLVIAPPVIFDAEYLAQVGVALLNVGIVVVPVMCGVDVPGKI